MLQHLLKFQSFNTPALHEGSAPGLLVHQPPVLQLSWCPSTSWPCWFFNIHWCFRPSACPYLCASHLALQLMLAPSSRGLTLSDMAGTPQFEYQLISPFNSAPVQQPNTKFNFKVSSCHFSSVWLFRSCVAPQICLVLQMHLTPAPAPACLVQIQPLLVCQLVVSQRLFG